MGERWEAVKAMYTEIPASEESIPLRVTTTLAVITGIASTAIANPDSWNVAMASIGLTICGSIASWFRRKKSNWWLKLLIAAGMLWAAGDFLRNAIANPTDTRIPLAHLLIWLQGLHSFDLPRRHDLDYSLLVGLILMCVAGSISRDLLFAPMLGVFCGLALAALIYHQLSVQRRHLAPGVRAGPRALVLLLPVALLVGSGALLVFLALPRWDRAQVRALPVSLRMRFPSTFSGALQENRLPRSGADKGKGELLHPKAYYGFTNRLDLNFRGSLPEEVVMRVQSTEANYWRGMAFDHYNGQQWTMSQGDKVRNLQEVRQRFISVPLLYDRDQAMLSVPRHEVVQTYYIEVDMTNLVLAVDTPVQLYFPTSLVALDPYGGIRAPVELASGIVYSVISHVPNVSPEMLRRRISRRYLSSPGDNYLQLPPRLPARVRSLARQLTARETTQYDKVQRLVSYLQTQYTYRLETPPYPRGTDVVDYFMFERREGFCEQFASALAVMARVNGFPSRLATGYTTGRYNPFTGYYEVRGGDAHAWVEIYFPRFGWLPFDPSPNYVAPLHPERVTERWVGSWLWDYLKGVAPAPLRQLLQDAEAAARRLLALPAWLAILPVALVLLAGVARWRRRRTQEALRAELGAAPPPRLLALAALYRRMLRLLRVHRRPPQTARELARQIVRDRDHVRREVEQITEVYQEGLYARQSPPDDRVHEAENALQSLEEKLNRRDAENAEIKR